MRADRMGRIYENRVAQLTDTGYKAEIRRLRLAERATERQQAVSDGRELRLQRYIRTPDEQEKFDSQRQAAFKDLSPVEQEQLNTELATMWAGIPAHVRDKARKLIS